MKLTKKINKGERIMLYSALFFLFFLFLIFYSKAVDPNSIEIRVPNVTGFTYSFEMENIDPNSSMIVDDCREENTTLDKVNCMVMYAYTYIEYNRSNPTNNLSDMFLHGTNCVGFCNYYSKISSMINLHHKRMDLYYGNKAHCASYVIGETHFCPINQHSYWCWAW